MKKSLYSTLSIIILILVLLSVLSVSVSGRSGSAVDESSLTDGCFLPDNSSRDYDIIFVCPIIENPYWEKCISGMHLADEELGTHTTVIGPQTADNFTVEIVDYIAQAVDSRPDGILTYASIPAMAPYIEKAAELGIPVIAVDADATTDKRYAYVGTDSYSLGYKAGETMLSMTGQNAKVGYICTSFEANNEMTMFKAFRDATFDAGLEIVDSRAANNDPETAGRITGEMLAEHPDISAIFCTGGYNVTGAGQYLADNELDITLLGFEDVAENLELLREGYIDALLAQSPEEMGYISVYAMKEYLDSGMLSSTSYNTEYVLITKDTIDSYRLGSFFPNLSLKELRVGYYEGDASFLAVSADGRKSGYGYEYLQTIATLAGWRYSYEYGTREEILEKLRNGELDLVPGIYKTDDTEGFLLSSSDMDLPDPKRYFGVNRELHDILEELEGAVQKLQTENPTYTATLYSSYYELGGNNTLTEAEREYLSGFGELRFGYLRGNLPICDEADNGDPTGLAKNLMAHIASYTGIPVRPIAYNTIAELKAGLLSGEVDVIFPTYYDVWKNEESHIRQTDPIFDDRVMIVYSGPYTNDIMDYVAVAESNIGQANYMSRFYPNSEAVYYDSKVAVFNAVLNGEARCTVGCSQVFQKFLSEHSEYDRLHIAYLDASFEFGLSVHEENSYLISILNKAVSNMGSAKISSALLSYASSDKNVTLKDFIRDNSGLFVLTLLFTVAVISTLFILFIKQTKQHREIQNATTAALEEALEEAKVANKAKTRFLSAMSHDIRTPMNAILGMATIASEAPEVAEHIPYYLEKITTSGRHLLTLINDILDVAKIESGKLILTPIIFSLRASMRSLYMIIEPTAMEKDISFSVSCDELEHDYVLADKVHVEQIFLNLLSNAVKYTPAGGKITAALSGKLDEASGLVHLTFVVEDNGIGMSPEFIKKMYDSFSRVEDSRISEIQGSGLGLAIVKRMVDMMDGSIDCVSKEGVGTKFTVKLDFEAREPDTEDEHGDDRSLSLEGLHVLVAEDNDLNWIVISRYLELCTISCERAVDGQDCLDILNASDTDTYDLVLMDVQMPRLNGREATVKIRESEREDIRRIPVVALTADAFVGDVAACIEAGMDGQVTKPIDFDKLKQELKRVLLAKRHSSGDKSEAEAPVRPTEAEAPADTPAEQTEEAEECEIFSHDKLYALFGDEQTVIKLLQSFLSAHIDDRDKLQSCFEAGDYLEARQILHSLIGVSGNFCLLRLCQASQKLRLEAHEQRHDSFGDFSQVWDETIDLVTTLCNEPGSENI